MLVLPRALVRPLLVLVGVFAALATSSAALAAPAAADSTIDALPPSASAHDGGPASVSAGGAPSRPAMVGRAKGIALRQLGDPYRYGAAGPNAFDCSGLVFFATHAAGFGHVPRTSGAQAGFMRPIAKPRMRAGDFMYFYGSGGVYHAAVFLGWHGGAARMLHAPGAGERVRIARPWTTRWFGRTLR